MKLITQIKDLTETTINAGRDQIEDLQAGRQRRALLSELGELVYRQHCGDPIDETAIDPVLADLDRIAARTADDVDDARADDAPAGEAGDLD